MLPSFPYEITAKILKLATLQLVQSERRDYTLIGQTNAFLLSASLVCRTWRNIAQPLLRTHGIVHPGLTDIFVFYAEKQGALGTLEAVRIGVYANHDSTVNSRSGNWIGLQYLLEKATSLKSLEFVGDKVRFNKASTKVPSQPTIGAFSQALPPYISSPPTYPYPPNLTTVKILRDPADYVSYLENSPEDQILDLISNLLALTAFEVPDCWRSDAVEKACEARGVSLTWSSIFLELGSVHITRRQLDPTMLLSFPYEITEKILKLATLDLIRDERRHSTLVGQANAFLLSAALVSHTWRNIAQPLLLKHGLVHPTEADGFLAELERAGLKNSLAALRVGMGSRCRCQSWEADHREINLLALETLLQRIPTLRALEFVGKKLRFTRRDQPAEAWSHITSVSFTGYKSNTLSHLIDLEGAFSPTSLTFIESLADEVDGYQPGNMKVQNLFKKATSLHLETSGTSVMMRTLLCDLLRAPLAEANLQSIHLEATTPYPLQTYFFGLFRLELIEVFSLKSLATHLAFFRAPTMRARPPDLTTVKILRDPADYESELWTSPEHQILNLISNLWALKELEVPDCWRSDAVEEACEARGVVLTWSYISQERHYDAH
ncbi:hypothetical protein RQP46_010511 [Phenoliferia psychrophenolica]